MANVKKVSNFKILLLVFVFIFPVIIGQIFYVYREHLPFKTLNHGILLKPVLNAEHLSFIAHEKKWKIVYINQNNCDAICEKISTQLKNLQLGLGKNSNRVTTNTLNDDDINVGKLKTEFAAQGHKDFIVSNKIYLIDPLDNIFMYYPSSTNLMNIMKDLKKVLEVSQIG